MDQQKEYIYGGFVSLENLNGQSVFDLVQAADEPLLGELVESLETHLIENNAHWLRSHFANIYKTCTQNNRFKELQKWCDNILVKYPNLVFDSEDFTSLKEHALISLIKRDDLQMEEIKIWNHVIEWGIAQNSTLPSDIENWSYENFITLKTTLQNCLPLIRYFQVSGDDVAKYILPYSLILEKNLWKDLASKNMSPNHQISSTILPPRIISVPVLPSRSTEPFSTVINEEHAAEIASWIDKKANSYNTTDNPYEFKLLLRGSRDGFTREAFWNLCNLQANTVTVSNVKGPNNNLEKIIGGYNPIAWDSSVNGYSSCQESFIFSLKNGVVPNSILSRVKQQQYAFCFKVDRGACFGGCDLRMFCDGDNSSCFVSRAFPFYEKSICDNQNYLISESVYKIA
ncbi:hypothetical protein C2G38_2211486 [Gigaspora rosea]|uniref:TLDc domain-containing protein n=1 Tax=Gigaspora rosea TaxID=44941 RepID=A0A397UMC0_9GLOM|nr:hypothetical protein C2G38_2211486 [Gigaspora rosea]